MRTRMRKDEALASLSLSHEGKRRRKFAGFGTGFSPTWRSHMANKKRTSLDAVLGLHAGETRDEGVSGTAPPPQYTRTRRAGIKQQTAYLPHPVYEQLRKLAFEERRKMHDYILEGLDRVFRDRGLPSIAELTGKHDERV